MYRDKSTYKYSFIFMQKKNYFHEQKNIHDISIPLATIFSISDFSNLTTH